MKIKQTIRKVISWAQTDKRRATMLAFIALFAIVGTIALIVSRAATPSISIEVENGNRSGNAIPVDDPNASGGKAIMFEQIATNPPPLPQTWGDHTGIFLNASRQNFDMAKALGVKWVKFSWEQNWGAFDYSLIDYAHSIGLKVMETCQKTPHSYTMADVTPFSTWCAHWVDKGVDAIEIGNEWNHPPFWVPDTNGNYSVQAAITDATTNAIRAKSATIKILNSGWSPESSPDLPQEAMGKMLDASNGSFKSKATNIGHHPYAYNCDSPLLCNYPTRRDWNAFMASKDIYANAVIRGYDKPFIFSEIGAPSGGGNNLYTGQAFTLASQAKTFTDYIAGIKQLRAEKVPIDVVFWGTIRDGQNATIPVEETFGLYDVNWNIKPAGQVVKNQSSQAW